MRPVNNQPFTGAMWYKTILESAACNLGDGLYTTKPDGYYTATDAIHVSANLLHKVSKSDLVGVDESA